MEKFYIKLYHTYYKEGGYNLTYGGDTNPMDDVNVRQRHREKMSTDTQRQIDRDNISKYNKSDIRKIHDKETSIRQKGIYNKQFKVYNSSRQISVGMIKDGTIVQRFNSLADACKFLGKPTKEAGHILKVCDVVNKFGRPAKMYGYSWTKLT